MGAATPTIRVLLIDDSAVDRLVATRELSGVPGLFVADDPESLDALDVRDIEIVISDRMLTADWEAARDRLLLRVPSAIVVEFSGGVGLNDYAAVATASVSFSKYEHAQLRQWLLGGGSPVACPAVAPDKLIAMPLLLGVSLATCDAVCRIWSGYAVP